MYLEDSTSTKDPVSISIRSMGFYVRGLAVWTRDRWDQRKGTLLFLLQKLLYACFTSYCRNHGEPVLGLWACWSEFILVRLFLRKLGWIDHCCISLLTEEYDSFLFFFLVLIILRTRRWDLQGLSHFQSQHCDLFCSEQHYVCRVQSTTNDWIPNDHLHCRNI